MRNQPGRITRLEQSQQAQDAITLARLADVIANPAAATVTMGAPTVDRIMELLDIARTRRQAANHDEL